MPPSRHKPDNRLRKLWDAKIPDHVIDLACSPDGRQVAAAAVSGPVVIFNLSDGKIVASLAGHKFGTTALSWHPHGEALATVGQDGQVRIWDTTLWQERASLDGGSAWVDRVAYSPDGQRLATAAGKKLRVWDATGSLVREWADHAATLADLAWRPGTSHISIAAYGGLKVYDPEQAEPVIQWDYKGSPLKLAWSPNGRILAHGNQDASVHFRDPKRLDSSLVMSGYQHKIRELSWDQSSQYLATGGSPVVCVWDCSGAGPEGRKPQGLQGHRESLTCLAWQRQGFLLASGSAEGLVHLYQPANKKNPLVGQEQLPDSPTMLAWSADDKLVVAGASDGTVQLLKVT